MAFQHQPSRRNRTQPLHTADYDERASSISETIVSDHDGDQFPGGDVLLLFGPSTSTSTSTASTRPSTDGGSEEGQEEEEDGWTNLHSPPPRVTRLDSYTTETSGMESASTTSASSTQGNGRQRQMSTRMSGFATSLSLLPSHDGNGVFVRNGQVESLRGTTSGSSVGEASSSSFSEGDYDEEREGGWALTEAALSTITNHYHPNSARRLTSRGRPDDNDDEREDEAGELSAGFTSGSEEGSCEHARDLTSRKIRATRYEFDQEVHQSLSALSAGIGATRRTRRLSHASRSPSIRNRQPLEPVVGSISLQRSLSPGYPASLAPSSEGGRFSVGSNGQKSHRSSKRRHRQAAGREETSSYRRFEVEKFERIEQEERLRAERMKTVLKERVKENEILKGKAAVLMGGFASKMMDIDPSTFPVLAAANDPTPTPSRASSPPLFARFSHKLNREFARSCFESIGDSSSEAQRLAEEDASEDEGNLTETEREAASTAISSSAHRAEWVHSATPPVFAPRSPPSHKATSRQPFRSRSTIPSYAIPFSATCLPSSRLNSSPPSRSISLPYLRTQHSTSHPATETVHMTHEERILHASSHSAVSNTSSLPWGGELDSSFELAMSVWKRFLRRLTHPRSPPGSTSHTPSHGSPQIASVGLPIEARWGVESAESGSEVGVY